MLPFRSSKQNSPRSSIDSAQSFLDLDYPEDTPRRLSKSTAPSRVQSVQIDDSTKLNGSNKLRKKSAATPAVSLSNVWDRDRVTGEYKDHTNMLHSLAHEFDLEPSGSKLATYENTTPARPPSEVISVLPPAIWNRIISLLPLPDHAALSLSSKSSHSIKPGNPIQSLNDPSNFRARIDFLHRLDATLPEHLLCYVCAIYHLRLDPGKETLRPSNIANPVFDCPYSSSSDPTKKFSRHRITFGRALPFPFVQLALRHHHYGPTHGIPALDLGRRYKDRPEVGTWSHQTRWAVIDDHLYVRVVSTAFTTPNLPPAGLRHLLYSREDFVPFFSVCSHWRDGNLTPACKCALSHIPAPISGSGVQRVAKDFEQKWLTSPQSQIVSMCEVCKPLRRCPECPTEHLIEIRLQEDRSEKDPLKLFKHAIVVTRWSDLGDGSAPWCPEWAAINGNTRRDQPLASATRRKSSQTAISGSLLAVAPVTTTPASSTTLETSAAALTTDEQDDGLEPAYDSFAVLGRRAISGTFESFFNPEQIPPARLISMNPNNERLGEKGHNWY